MKNKLLRYLKTAAFFSTVFCSLLQAFSTQAQTVTQAWATLASNANPYGIAIDGSGNIYTCNYGNSTVSKITADGSVTQRWAASLGGKPYGIAIDGSGNVYTANMTNNKVSKITAAGSLTAAWATLASNANPYAIAIDGSGNVYTANHGNNTVSKIITTAPSVPTITSITAGNGSLTVNFTAPSSDGGATITNYLYSTNGGSTFTSAGTTTSPITITGLTNGTAYSVEIEAVNSVGTGAASNSVSGTPVAPPAPTITAHAAVTATYGDGNTYTAASTTNSGDALSYASSNTSVATVNAGTGALTIVGAGTATITVSDAGNANYSTGTNTVSVTVNQGTPSIIPATAITATYGDGVSYTAASTTNSGDALSYSSSNTSVVTVIASTGALTIVGAGTATITVSDAGNSSYLSGTVTVNVTVGQATATITPAASIGATMGDGGTYSAASSTNSGNALTYSVDNTNVATVDANSGAVTIVGTGTATIMVTDAGNGNYTSAIATININVVLTAPTGAATQTFCSGATVANLSATGSLIKWYDATTGGNLLDTSTVLGNGAVYFSSQTVGGVESTTRLAVTATVNTPVTPNLFAGITTGRQVVCDGGSLTIAAIPTNGGTAPSYIWYNGGNIISGQTTDTYTYSPIAGTRDTITVRLIANNACQTTDNVLSNIVTPYITPYVTPSVSISSSQTGNVCSGKTVTISAKPIKFGTSPRFQWFNGSTALAIPTTQSYYTYTPTVGNTDVISVVVSNATNACQTTSTATSNSITPVITQSVTPSISIAATQSGTICSGSSVTINATATNGGSTSSYQWYKGSTAISGATTSSYSYTPTVGNKDSISVKLTANNTCQTTNVVNSKTITPVVVAPVTPSVTIVSTQAGGTCSIKTVTFNATPVKFGSSPQFQWFNGTTALTAATTQSYYSYKPAVGNSDKISVVVTGANNTCQTASTAQSASITPVITAPSMPSIPTVSIVANPGSSVTTGTKVGFTVGSLTGIATPKYQWYKGSTAISGATTSSYSYAPANKDVISLNISGLDSTCQVASTATSNKITFAVTAPVATISENRVTSESAGIQASLYPNPSHGSASLKLQGVTSNVTITVRGIYGNIVATLNASKDGEVKLPTQSLASGLYIVSINDGITRKDIKWVKN